MSHWHLCSSEMYFSSLFYLSYCSPGVWCTSCLHSPVSEILIRVVRSGLTQSRVLAASCLASVLTTTHRQSDDAQLYAVTIRRQIGNTNPARHYPTEKFGPTKILNLVKLWRWFLAKVRPKQRKMFGMLYRIILMIFLCWSVQWREKMMITGTVAPASLQIFQILTLAILRSNYSGSLTMCHYAMGSL